MDEATESKLFAAIATYAVEHDSYLTKTKLLKLLYLFDVEYFRLHRETFTGFHWKFFHLGPWTNEFDPVLEGILARGVLSQTRGLYDGALLTAPNMVDPDSVFPGLKDSLALRGILKTWGGASTGQILDYVYFKTEPMECAIRNEPLDFSVIPANLEPVYKRSSSGATASEIAALRRRFTEVRTKRKVEATSSITPPRYDEAFEVAISTMDKDEDY